MCGGEIEVSKYMLVGAVRAGARPVFNLVHKDEVKWNRAMETSTLAASALQLFYE